MDVQDNREVEDTAQYHELRSTDKHTNQFFRLMSKD